jgi:hypothetical protein
MRDVHRRAARFNKQIRQRDFFETLAGLIVVVAFGSFAWAAPQTVAKVGAVVVVAGCVGAMTRLHLARNRHSPSPEMSAREFCTIQLKHLEDQISLLSTVAWWYIAPLLGGAAIFVLGADGPIGAVVVTLGLLLAIGAVIYWLNHRAVQRHLRPLRDDLARLLQDMESREGDATGGVS